MALFIMLALPVNSDGATLSGTVYVDINTDGMFQEGEWGVRSGLIQLYRLNDENDDVGELIKETLTNPYGQYFFEDLSAGFYRVVDTDPCYIGNSANVGQIWTENVLAVDGTGTPNSAMLQISGIILNGNSEAMNYNFGNDQYPLQLYSKRMLIFGGNQIQPGKVPEPATIFQLLAVVGLAGSWTFFRKRQKAS